MQPIHRTLPLILFVILVTSSLPGLAQEFSTTLSKSEVEKIIASSCATCHGSAMSGATRAPDFFHLSSMTPRSIVASLESGRMQVQGSVLSEEERIAVAEYLTNRRYEPKKPPTNMCDAPPTSFSDVHYFGWGGNHSSTGFIDELVAGLTKRDVPNLKLKWAFGFDGGTVTRTKPAVVDNHLIFGTQFAEIYCVNMETGCVAWVAEAHSMIRGGVAISEDVGAGIHAYVADFGGNVLSIDITSGEILWETIVKNDPNNAVTGTPVYYDGMLYVPLTSMEVVTAGDDAATCCVSSGQVVAVNAETGEEVWRHRVIQEEAKRFGTNRKGNPNFGPSGAPVWSSPTVDPKRGYLYIGTGENNSNPPTKTSDAIQALDLKTGALVWNVQATPNDAYISACADRTNAANCPDPAGPDVDFGMAPVLVERPDGSEVLVVGQKSGVVHCLSPEDGSILWQQRIGRGGALGGIHWGLATDGRYAFLGNSDWMEFGSEAGVEANPGLFALDLMTGAVVWKHTPDASECEGKPGCQSTNSAAPTMIEGVVFSGSLDGFIRAYDSETGEVIWEFDTNRSYETVNGVDGHGGAIDGPGPVIANGMLFVNSGYGLFGQMQGNVLLAFAIE